MNSSALLYGVLYFIITVIVAWVVFSLILLWFKPALLNADGTVNWWTTLWVIILVIVFIWVVMLIFMWILGSFQHRNYEKFVHFSFSINICY